MKRPIEIAAQLAGYSSKVDRSLTLRFNTAQEIADEDVVVINNYLQTEGYLLFSPNQFSDSDIPAHDTPESGLKTPAQRLRAVLYKLFMQAKEAGDFDLWYRKKMETIINHYKSKLG